MREMVARFAQALQAGEAVDAPAFELPEIGPGVYALTLLLDGKPADRTALNLVQGL